MKPFRGKPKKPKRSNGEIHRQRRWLRVGGRCSAVPFLRLSREHATVRRCLVFVVVHFSPSRTSRPAGCRSTAREGACRVAGKTARGKLPVAWPAARRYTQRYKAAPRARRARRKRSLRISGGADLAPSPVRARCWQYGVTFDRPPLVHARYRSATLLLWVLLGPVLKHGPRSLTCTRVIGTSDT